MNRYPLPKPPMLNRAYSLGEEIANSVTHGIGAMLSVAGLTLLVTYAAIQGDAWRVVSFSIYGGSMILLFLMSTLYHSFQNEKVKQVFKLLDHCAIYLLIAGTYTPFLLVTLRGTTGWILFAIIWLLAFTGIIFKLAFRNRFKKLSLLTYVAMGWLALFVGQELTRSLSAGGMAWLIAGGLAYTLGVLFYVWKKLPYNHAIWHLFVLAGSLCHYTTIFVYVLPDS
ncbi:PAQR family membrane homeostasis protein TrhA [Endozoicomonas lisbonensis]|uniref:Hemolysin III n=1 Tax=Endozoicomonas lisbonensis TaxID=3120522 RepID=A0ABV2SLD0_9GAMM